jgi:hypothetical protein
MKWQAVIVLITIMLGIVVPASLPQIVARDGRSTIGTLDVCHAAAPGLSATAGEMPYVSSFLGSQKPAPRVAYRNHDDSVLLQFLFSQLNDRPPKA